MSNGEAGILGFLVFFSFYCFMQLYGKLDGDIQNEQKREEKSTCIGADPNGKEAENYTD